MISEYETSIGPAAVAPYETPGTQAFAETVRPFVRDHNTILLSNHGIVCWADTVSHAEWFVETFETYCKTYLIAQQIGKPLKFFPENKIQELLEIKRRLGLPDARMRSCSEEAAPQRRREKQRKDVENYSELWWALFIGISRMNEAAVVRAYAQIRGNRALVA